MNNALQNLLTMMQNNNKQEKQINMNNNEQMAKGGQWLQKAESKMEKKKTKGLFTEYCGGNVTNDCIERGLKSPDPTIRKRAAFAKNVRKIVKKEFGGENNLSYGDYYKGDTFANNILKSAEKAFGGEQSTNPYGDWRGSANNSIGDSKYAYPDGGVVNCPSCEQNQIKLDRTPDDVKKAYEYISKQPNIPQTDRQILFDYLQNNNQHLPEGTNVLNNKFAEGGEPQAAPQQETQQQGQQGQQGRPNITYEQFEQFVSQYPEYIQRLIQEIIQMQRQQQGQQQQAPQESTANQ